MQLELLADNKESQFRDLYFHLYSNSNSARSERILSDLSKLILASIAYGKGDLRSEIFLFMNGNGSANALLLPGIVRLFPSSGGQRPALTGHGVPPKLATGIDA
jgi:type I restriction enzyme M protein